MRYPAIDRYQEPHADPPSPGVAAAMDAQIRLYAATPGDLCDALAEIAIDRHHAAEQTDQDALDQMRSAVTGELTRRAACAPPPVFSASTHVETQDGSEVTVSVAYDGVYAHAWTSQGQDAEAITRVGLTLEIRVPVVYPHRDGSEVMHHEVEVSLAEGWDTAPDPDLHGMGLAWCTRPIPVAPAT